MQYLKQHPQEFDVIITGLFSKLIWICSRLFFLNGSRKEFINGVCSLESLNLVFIACFSSSFGIIFNTRFL